MLFEGTIGDGGPISISERVSDDEDGTDLMYGLGAAFTFNNNCKARIESERFPIGVFTSFLCQNGGIFGPYTELANSWFAIRLRAVRHSLHAIGGMVGDPCQ